MKTSARVDYLFLKGPRGMKALMAANVPAARAQELCQRYKERGWKMVVAGRFAVVGDEIAVEVVAEP